VVDLTPEFSDRFGVFALSVDLTDPEEVLAERPDTDSDLLFTLSGCVLFSPEESTLEGLAPVVVPLALCKSGL
jgi:hypothetical protein